MRQSARVLGWTATLLTILVFSFIIMSTYSLIQLVTAGERFRAGEMDVVASGETVVFSIPVTINNTSHFEISEFGITTTLKDSRGTCISDARTVFGSIRSWSTVLRRHNLSISIQSMIRSNLTYLLFNDDSFLMDTLVDLRYANFLGFKIRTANTSVPWGAPLSNFQLGRPTSPQSVPGEPRILSVSVPFSFENHSPLSIQGAISMKIYDHQGTWLGSGSKPFDVKADSFYSDEIQIDATRESLRNYIGKGYLEIQFEVAGFSFELPRVEYG